MIRKTKPKRINMYEKIISMQKHKENYDLMNGNAGEKRLSRYYRESFYNNDLSFLNNNDISKDI